MNRFYDFLDLFLASLVPGERVNSWKNYVIFAIFHKKVEQKLVPFIAPLIHDRIPICLADRIFCRRRAERGPFSLVEN